MTTDNNPLLIDTGFPSYDKIQPEHIKSAITCLLANCEKILAELESTADCSWESLMQPMEQIDLFFEYGWSPVGHLLSVANSDELRLAHDEVLEQVVEFGLKLRQSDVIYQKLIKLRNSDEWSSFQEAQRRIIQRSIQSAELSGIGLQGEQRERFNQIEQRLSQLSNDFSNHVLDATKAFSLDLTSESDIEGFPASLRRLTASAWTRASENKDKPAATPESGPWRITLDQPCFGPFLEHCRNRALRERVYRDYICRASSDATDNSPLITEILSLRREQSMLLGFTSYAELSLSRKMAAHVDAVQRMFDELLAASLDVAHSELKELAALAAQSGQTEPLAHWDIAFWAERLREQRYAFTDEQLRPYFSLPRVLDGLFALCHRLFGITVRSAEGKAPIWHPDVQYFEVDNEAGEQIAGFFLDPFSRPQNKRGGAWMSDCMARSRTSAGLRLPVAHLVCNSTPPVELIPSLMTFREVETLFHEFGHGLQHMLTTVDFRDAAGISGVEWDAVELPSQFMENWCYHRPTLMGMARHFETGEPLPEDLFQKLCNARTYRAASQMLRQLQLGMTDMELHARYNPTGQESPFEVERRITKRTSLLPPLPENRFLCSFQHIFSGGYAAGYYSYKWAEVLSADAFGAFEDAGLDNEKAVAETGRRFRETVLALGGSQHPMTIFRAFRGREPNAQALLKHYGLSPSTPSL